MITTENFFYYFPTVEVHHCLQFEKYAESFASFEESTQTLVSVSYQLDDKKITYYRSYNNIANILGDIDGLF